MVLEVGGGCLFFLSLKRREGMRIQNQLSYFFTVSVGEYALKAISLATESSMYIRRELQSELDPWDEPPPCPPPPPPPWDISFLRAIIPDRSSAIFPMTRALTAIMATLDIIICIIIPPIPIAIIIILPPLSFFLRASPSSPLSSSKFSLTLLVMKNCQAFFRIIFVSCSPSSVTLLSSLGISLSLSSSILLSTSSTVFVFTK
uniref:Uncharacterized protein n=1 Tax=Cacopsylla melanoneura TaxID=428564 RepID=A0A8D9BRY7_9HEMI